MKREDVAFEAVLKLNDKAYETLETVAALSGKGLSESFRDAIFVYKWLLTQVVEGKEILRRDKDGTMRVLVLLPSDKIPKGNA